MQLEMKLSELADGFIGFANKGAVWGKYEHIAKSGHYSETLCGVRMLSNNYVNESGLVRCVKCIAAYEELRNEALTKHMKYFSILVKITDGLNEYVSRMCGRDETLDGMNAKVEAMCERYTNEATMCSERIYEVDHITEITQYDFNVLQRYLPQPDTDFAVYPAEHYEAMPKAVEVTYDVIDYDASNYSHVYKLFNDDQIFYNRDTGLYELWTPNKGSDAVTMVYKNTAYKRLRDYCKTIEEVMMIADHVGVMFIDRPDNSVFESLNSYKYIRNPDNNVIMECNHGQITFGNITFDEVQQDLAAFPKDDHFFSAIGESQECVLHNLNNETLTTYIYSLNDHKGLY